MILNYFGAATTPPQLNSCLGRNADPLYWSVASLCSGGLVHGGTLSHFSWGGLDQQLAQGDPAIVGMLRGQTGWHFVVVVSGGGDIGEAYRIIDPWDGTATKTLGYYLRLGYNLKALVTYSGVARNCGRLDDGLGVRVGGIVDGGVYGGPVHVEPAPDGRRTGPPRIGPISGGHTSTTTPSAGASSPAASPTPTASPASVVTQGPSPTAVSGTTTPQGAPVTAPPSGGVLVNPITPLSAGVRVEFAPIPDAGVTIDAEGVYEMLMNLRLGPADTRLVTVKFTIDRTPPAVDLGFLNPMAVTAAASTVPAATTPLLQRPGRIRLLAKDKLSGVDELDYSLDGGAWMPNGDDVSASRDILVDQPGMHTIAYKAVDLAGNVSPVVVQSFIVSGAPATPGPSPSPSPAVATTSPVPSATHSAAPSATPAPVLRTASVAGAVLNDTDGDGAPNNDGEKGLAGIGITLLKAGQSVASAITDANGHYAFMGLVAGGYQATFRVPAGFSNTGSGSLSVSLTPGQAATGEDFFAQQLASISGTVVLDLDQDGPPNNDNESGFAGATVDLKDVTGKVLATRTSTSTGTYSFAGLTPGSYILAVTAPGYGVWGYPIAVQVGPGQAATGVDFYVYVIIG
jgi:hypothetical protein